MIRELGNALNALIRAKAEQFGWGVVDGIKSAYDGHGYCADATYFCKQRVVPAAGRL